MVAHGFRNPFRLRDPRPGTNDLYVGDVPGGSRPRGDQPDRGQPAKAMAEQLRLAVLRGGAGACRGYDRDLDLCKSLYRDTRAVTLALLQLPARQARRRTDEACPNGGASVVGHLACNAGEPLPRRLPGRALLRRLLAQAASGSYSGAPRAAQLPDPANVKVFAEERRRRPWTSRPGTGGGFLYYADLHRRDRCGGSPTPRRRRPVATLLGVAGERAPLPLAVVLRRERLRPTRTATTLTYAMGVRRQRAARRARGTAAVAHVLGRPAQYTAST